MKDIVKANAALAEITDNASGDVLDRLIINRGTPEQLKDIAQAGGVDRQALMAASIGIRVEIVVPDGLTNKNVIQSAK